ncbi:JmjC-domain-containing protein, partial [Ramicandelaber brevisporus]
MPLTPTSRGTSPLPAASKDKPEAVTATSAAPESKRLFGLETAPTYYPTVEEFADPLEYISKIRAEAEQYGICKIVPPEGFQPPFSIDTARFRFHTRIQHLNSLEGKTRSTLNFLEQLQKFHAMNGTPIGRLPHLDHRPIDLFKLRKEVQERGGFDVVNGKKQWAAIGRDMGYQRKSCTSMSNGLKSAYQRVILPFEQYLQNHGSADGLMDAVPDGTSNSSSNVVCSVCDEGNVGKNDKIIECDSCEKGFHLKCLPSGTKVPSNNKLSEFHCESCIRDTGVDFGFEDGGEYTLMQFQKKCNEFKKRYFAKYYEEATSNLKNSGGNKYPESDPIEGVVPEHVVEREFWRLSSAVHENVEVEYGADLHSTHHGSGFPTTERDPLDPYSIHPWNLNVMPVLPGSLFAHIKGDVSGMMNPWLYVGMCFSTFCWHNEDHYTYSINYMHFGDTKTWYGVPGSDAGKFDEAMRKAMPDLFKKQPDLLFQLVTLLSPQILKDNGVRVVALDQRPGQYVVTFPQAFHAGFNHGLNFNEAVNFALPDWEPYGVECAERYREFSKQPVFSHDELLMNIAQNVEAANQSTGALWLSGALDKLLKRELEDRNRIRSQYPNINESILDHDVREEEYQCIKCKTYSYLSAITCSCTADRIVCLRHYDDLCNCSVHHRSLRLRFMDEELKDIVRVASDGASRPFEWQKKFRSIMQS